MPVSAVGTTGTRGLPAVEQRADLRGRWSAGPVVTVGGGGAANAGRHVSLAVEWEWGGRSRREKR